MNHVRLKTYEEIYPIAKRLFDEQSNLLLEIFPDILVEHVGGSSIPGSITSGDLDIQIRTDKSTFTEICEVLKKLYRENKRELWTNDFALFHWKDHPQMPMSIVLTVIDSPYDDFSRTRDFLISHPEALHRYNSLKKEYANRGADEYRAAKRAFFGQNGHNNLLD